MPEPLDERVTWLLSRANLRAQQLLRDAFVQAGSRGYHYRLMLALAEVGPTSQVELGRQAEIDRSDVVAALDELVARGQVRREPDPQDGRRNRVALTPAGRRELGRLDRMVTDVQDRVLDGLNPRDRATLARLLGRIGPS